MRGVFQCWRNLLGDGRCSNDSDFALVSEDRNYYRPLFPSRLDRLLWMVDDREGGKACATFEPRILADFRRRKFRLFRSRIPALELANRLGSVVERCWLLVAFYRFAFVGLFLRDQEL